MVGKNVRRRTLRTQRNDGGCRRDHVRESHTEDNASPRTSEPCGTFALRGTRTLNPKERNLNPSRLPISPGELAERKGFEPSV